jgi:diketogulonate reductase-like aldo/keto reductase
MSGFTSPQYSDLAKALAIRKASWHTLELTQKAGKCKYIGVSTYPANMLREMMKYAEVMPAVNQLELHPRFASPELRSVAAALTI